MQELGQLARQYAETGAFYWLALAGACVWLMDRHVQRGPHARKQVRQPETKNCYPPPAPAPPPPPHPNKKQKQSATRKTKQTAARCSGLGVWSRITWRFLFLHTVPLHAFSLVLHPATDLGVLLAAADLPRGCLPKPSLSDRMTKCQYAKMVWRRAK